jgi:hypothetical protein
VEEQRLVAEHEELVEGEAGGRGDLRHEGGEPVDAVRDLADPRFHGPLLCRRDAGGSTPSSATASVDLTDTSVPLNRADCQYGLHITVQ